MNVKDHCRCGWNTPFQHSVFPSLSTCSGQQADKTQTVIHHHGQLSFDKYGTTALAKRAASLAVCCQMWLEKSAGKPLCEDCKEGLYRQLQLPDNKDFDSSLSYCSLPLIT